MSTWSIWPCSCPQCVGDDGAWEREVEEAEAMERIEAHMRAPEMDDFLCQEKSE